MGKDLSSIICVLFAMVVLSSSLTLKDDLRSTVEHNRGYENVVHFLSAHFA